MEKRYRNKIIIIIIISASGSNSYSFPYCLHLVFLSNRRGPLGFVVVVVVVVVVLFWVFFGGGGLLGLLGGGVVSVLPNMKNTRDFLLIFHMFMQNWCRGTLVHIRKVGGVWVWGDGWVGVGVGVCVRFACEGSPEITGVHDYMV